MPKPTQGELLRILELEVASQRERVRSISGLVEQVQKENETLRQSNLEHRRDIAVLQSEIANLKKSLDQFEHRRWTLIVAIASAALGGFLTFLAQMALRGLAKS